MTEHGDTDPQPQPSPSGDGTPPTDTRLQLLGDLLTFQAKLALDGLRDLLLVPVSLIAGIIGLVRGGPDADQPFREVVALGRRTEVWINLFGRYRGHTADALLEPIREQMLTKMNEGLARQEDRSRTALPVSTSPEPAARPDGDASRTVVSVPTKSPP